jgi:predicted RND superfamily exporter protein
MTDSLPSWGSRLAGVVLHRRGLVLGVVGLFTLLGIGAMGRLEVSASLSDAVGDASPAARALGIISRHFSATDDLLVLVTSTSESPSRSSLIRFAERFAMGLEGDEEGGRLVGDVTWSKDPGFDAWFTEKVIPNAPVYLDEAGFDSLRGRLSTESIRTRVRRIETLMSAPGPLAQAAAQDAIADPFDIRGLIFEQLPPGQGGVDDSDAESLAISDDGRSLLLRVRPVTGPDDLSRAKRLVELARRTAASVPDEAIRVEFAGTPAIAARSATAIRRDLIRSVVGAVIGVQVLFLIAYRGWLAGPIVLLPASLGIVWAFGGLAIIGGELTPLEAAIGAILVGLGVDYAIHAVSAIDPDSPDVTGAIGRVTPGILCAGMTTIIAFAILALSRLGLLHGFAALGAAGIACALVATLALMPILMSGSGRAMRVVPRQWSACTRAGVRPREKQLLAISGLIVIACATLVVVRGGIQGQPLLPIDDSLDAMHPQPNPPLDAQRRVDELFGDAELGFPVLIEASNERELRERAHDVTVAFRSIETIDVRAVVGLGTLLPDESNIEQRLVRLRTLDIDRVEHDVDEAIEASILAPGALETAISTLDRMLRDPRVPSLDDVRAVPALARLFLPGARSDEPMALAYVVVGEPSDDRADRTSVAAAIRQALAPIKGTTLTGLPVLGDEAEQLAMSELPRLLTWATLGVVVWLGLFFRHALDVALALLPAVFTGVVLLSVWAWVGLELNIINVAAVPLLIGIGIDDGIFLVAAARDARRSADPRAALRRRFQEIRHAVITTSITTTLAFGSLAFTSTPAIRSLGWVVTIGICACLWGALGLLAPILILRSPRGETGAEG